MSLIEPIATAAPLLVGWTTTGLFYRRRLAAARHCPLTQLLTRDGWEKAALRRIRRGNVAVAVIDLDSFKAVNDTFGHAAGDAVLKATGHRLHLWAGASDGTAGRLGGDEFALVLTADDFQTGIEQLHELMTAPVDWQGQLLEVSTLHRRRSRRRTHAVRGPGPRRPGHVRGQGQRRPPWAPSSARGHHRGPLGGGPVTITRERLAAAAALILSVLVMATSVETGRNAIEALLTAITTYGTAVLAAALVLAFLGMPVGIRPVLKPPGPWSPSPW